MNARIATRKDACAWFLIMFPEYPNFKRLELKDLPIISKYPDAASANICELAPANLFIWKDFDNPQLTTINQNLCIFTQPANEPPYFLEPLGNQSLAETVDICLKHAGRISRASEKFVSRLDPDAWRIKCQRGQCDYIYETKTISELKGKKYDGKRNHIKRFKNRFPEYKFILLTPEMKKEALALFEAWFTVRQESRFFPKLAYTSQKNALEESFRYMKELKLLGAGIFAEGKMKGFIIGSHINPEMISAHFSYGLPEAPGISQLLLWEACNHLFQDSKYINLEQDLGIPGLRKAKLSYLPLRLERKFEIHPIQKPPLPA